MMRFVGKHSLFGGATAAPLLAAEFFGTGTLGIGAAFLARFNLVQQQFAGEESIQTLLASTLTLHLQSSRAVQQHHASGRLVHVLAAVTAGANKRLFNINFADTERRHSLRELIFLFHADRKRTHAGILTPSGLLCSIF